MSVGRLNREWQPMRGFLEAFASTTVPRSDARRSLSSLLLVAGALILVTLQSGVDSETNRAIVRAVAAMLMLTGVAVATLASAIRYRGVVGGVALGVLLVSVAVLASQEADTAYLFLYVWLGAQAWYFLSPRTAIALTMLTAVASGGAMAAASNSDEDTLTWWLLLTGTLVIVAALSSALRLRLELLASQDHLTGLLNRRGYQQRIELELARARRYGSPVSVVLGDLDDFKALNDRFGHRHGDEALQAFARLCQLNTRAIDFVSRVGGEEFVLVLSDTDQETALLVADRLRRHLHRELRSPDGAPITASFGVATSPQHGTEPEVLLDHADQAMYAAKALGRDRALAFSSDLRQHKSATDVEPHLEAVLLLAEALDRRDAGTGAHSHTVGALCEQIARALGWPAGRVEQVRLAGLLHDVGKIGVPDDILLKPGKLSPAEWAEIRKHPEVGARLVAATGLPEIAQWVLAHHERPDGRGYPYGSTGDEIPREARILSVADAYQAMTADRPYRRAIGQLAALAELQRGAGTQFDPHVVAALSRTLTIHGAPGVAVAVGA